MSDRPESWASWTLEVQELWDAIVRGENAEDAAPVIAAYRHLHGLLDAEDVHVQLAASQAVLELRMRYEPEFAEELRRIIRRETRDGQELVELGVALLQRAKTPEERHEAEQLLADVTAAIPPRGRA